MIDLNCRRIFRREKEVTEGGILHWGLETEKKELLNWFRQEIKKVQDSNVELSKEKDELSSKVEKASVIQAKNILAVTLNRKRKETTRINLIDKLRVCFTLRENPIAEAGPKKVYMRVIRPDSLVITNSPDNVFNYKDKLLIFALKKIGA